VGLSTMTSVWATGWGVTAPFFIAPAVGLWQTDGAGSAEIRDEVATVAANPSL